MGLQNDSLDAITPSQFRFHKIKTHYTPFKNTDADETQNRNSSVSMSCSKGTPQ